MRDFTTYLCFDGEDEIEAYVEYSYHWDRDERGLFSVLSEDTTTVLHGDEDINHKITPEMWEHIDARIEEHLP
jgi:hypothetical protein